MKKQFLQRGKGCRAGGALLSAAALLVCLTACGSSGRPVDTPIPAFTDPPTEQPATAQPTEAPALPESTPAAAESLPWEPETYSTYAQAYPDSDTMYTDASFGYDDPSKPNCAVHPHGMRDITQGETVYTFPVEDGTLVVRDRGTGELLWEIGPIGDDVIIGSDNDWIFLASADGNTLSRMDYHGAREVLYTDTLGLLDDAVHAATSNFSVIDFWSSNEEGGLDVCRLYTPELVLDRYPIWPNSLDKETVDILVSEDLLGPIIPVSTHTFLWTIKNRDCFALYEAAEAAGQALTPEAKLQIQRENHTREYTQYFFSDTRMTTSAMRTLSHEPEPGSAWLADLQTTSIHNISPYTTEAGSPEEAAESMANAFLEDMMVAADNRSFLLSDYRDIVIKVYPTTDFPTDKTYQPTKREIRDNTWIVYIEGEVCFQGFYYPVGPGEDVWTSFIDTPTPRGFLLTKEGDTYTMQSRYTAF